MKIKIVKATIIAAIFAVIFYAYHLSQEGFKALEKINNDVEAAKIKKPRFAMHYDKVQRENGKTSTHDGFISATDSTIIITKDMGLLHGKWIEEDVFITSTKTIFFNEESVVVHSRVLNASGRQNLVDIYSRSK